MRCCSILRFCLRQATPRRKPRPLCCASWFVCRPAHAPFTKNGRRARVSLGSNQITRTVTASELPPPRYCAQALRISAHFHSPKLCRASACSTPTCPSPEVRAHAHPHAPRNGCACTPTRISAFHCPPPPSRPSPEVRSYADHACKHRMELATQSVPVSYLTSQTRSACGRPSACFDLIFQARFACKAMQTCSCLSRPLVFTREFQAVRHGDTRNQALQLQLTWATPRLCLSPALP